jgi:ATPase family associated with various cellular activities (AAA)
MADSMLQFPEPLTIKYAPKTIEEFAGLDDLKPALLGFLANPYPSAWLFVGPSGTGKSNMGMVMAEQIPALFHHVGSRDCGIETVEKVCFDCQYMPWDPLRPEKAMKMHLVQVDEADVMTNAAQDAFLSRLDGTAPVPYTVFVFTANDTERLAERFISRCRKVVFAREQPTAAVIAHLRRIWRLEAPGKPEPDLAGIVRECHCNIRESMMKLELALLGLAWVAPVPPPPLGLESHAVANALLALEGRIGEREAALMFQEALKVCGRRIYVDGKLGTFTVQEANRVPEEQLLAALEDRANGGAWRIKPKSA